MSTEVVVTGVSIDHIPKELARNGILDSAPKDFTVFVSTCTHVNHSSFDIPSDIPLLNWFIVGAHFSGECGIKFGFIQL